MKRDQRHCGRLAVLGLVAIGAWALRAETVVWYHLDEKSPGQRHANNDTIVNAAATGAKFDGTATVYNGSSRSGESWLQPMGESSLPSGWGFYDPVSATSYAGNSAVGLIANKNAQSGWTGAIEVPYGAELDATGDFTMELFFKQVKTNYGEAPSVEQTLVCRQISDASGGSAIELTLAADARAVFRYAYEDDSGTVQTKTIYIDGVKYSDSRWHHMAVTYASATRALRLYVDRSLQQAVELPAALYPTKQPVILGVNPKRGWGGACAHIDEFRYSNAVLEPNQFIRAVGGDALPVLSETVVYQRFGSDAETVGGGSGLYGGVAVNEAYGEETYGGGGIVHAYGTTPVTGEVCSASLFMTNATLGTKFPNARAAILRPSESSKSGSCRSHAWTWQNVPARLSSGDFTYEAVFRMPKDCPTTQQYFACEKSSWQLAVSDGHVKFRWTDIGGKAVNDGRWHHLALVHELATKSVKFYLDYRLTTTFAGAGSKGELGQNGDGTLTFGAYETPHYSESWSMIDLDEIRVTRRALALGEMLHPGDGVTFCDLDMADAYGWESGLFAYGAPDLSKASHSYSNEVPYATSRLGLEAEGVANTRSFFFNKAKSSGGILLPDPEISLPRGSFTAELVFKVDKNAHEAFANDCAYLFCQSGAFYVRYNQNGTIRFCNSAWKDIAAIPEPQVDDGAWHHLAYVQDFANGELRAYFDYREVGRLSGLLGTPTGDASKTLYVNCGCWNNTSYYSTGPMLLNRLRVTRRALRPTEFVTSRALEGNLLHWAGFERTGEIVPDYGFGVSATIAQYLPGAGRLTNGADEFVRDNRRAAAATGFTFSRNALLERADQSVEFFLRGTAAGAGADLVALVGAAADKPVWALRQTADGLKVVVTTAAGAVTEVAAAGELPEAWTHFAVVFAPDAESTKVTVYRDYAVIAEGAFDGALQVDGVPTSGLAVGAFEGRVDELRVFKGALAVGDMLRATPQGLAVIVR